MSRGRPLTIPQKLSHPDPQGTKKQALVYEAAGLLGTLYVDVTAAATNSLDPAQLLRLADQIARTGMAASRRIRKAAESSMSEQS